MGDWMAVSKNIRPCRKQVDISVAIFGEGSRHIEFLKTLLIFDVLLKRHYSVTIRSSFNIHVSKPSEKI